MHNGIDYYLIFLDGVEQCIRKSSDKATMNLKRNFRPHFREGFNPVNCRFNLGSKFCTKSRNALVVKINRGQELFLGSRVKCTIHALARTFASAKTSSLGIGVT